MQSVIVIYHHPQECGSPALTFISQKTGEVLEVVPIPEGYSYSGHTTVPQLQKVGTHTESVCQWPEPTPDNVVLMNYTGRKSRFYKYKIREINNIKLDSDIIPTYTADVVVDIYLEKNVSCFDRHLDEFRQKMEQAGFDMSGWCTYKRMKTPFFEFLTKVIPTYNKDYKVMNIIKIG